MRLIRVGLTLLLVGSVLIPSRLTAQAADSTKPKVKKPPSALKSAAKRIADTAATAAAGAGVQSLLGKKAGGVASALGAGGLNPCATAQAASAGAAIVGVAKSVAKKPKDSTAVPAPAPCVSAAQVQALVGTAGVPGMPGGVAVPAPAAAAGANPMSGMGMVAAMTPIGMAVTAAPMAGKAAKGIKGMFGGKPQDKIAMLRELGKGRLELKDVRFIEGTAELEPGFEPTLAALGEAIQLAEGTYILHVAAEEGEKNTPPDTALARKRIEKVWAAILVNGVPDQRIIAVSVLSPEMQAGRKPPKAGQARVEFIRLPKQP
jgi:hypothetical protein